MRPRSSSALFLLLAAMTIVAAACTVSPDSSENAGPAGPAPTSLREVKIDPSFTFASTRGVTFHITVDAKTLPNNDLFPLQIWNLRGEMLIQAKVPTNGVFSADFPLPLADRDLLLKLNGQEFPLTVGSDNVVHFTVH